MRNGAVIVAGSLHLDVVVDAPGLPRLDETMMGSAVHYVCGGKGGNQAVAARRDGAEVSMIGRIGQDRFGDTLLQNLRKEGIGTDSIAIDPDEPSGMSVAIVDENGSYGAVVVSGSNKAIEADVDAAVFDGVAVLLLQNEIPQTANIAAAEKAKNAGALVVLNAAPMRKMDSALLSNVDILIVNRVEAATFFGLAELTFDEALSATRKRDTGPKDLLITLGEEGTIHHRLGEEAAHHRAFTVPVVSTHGAGDVFAGTLCSGLARGLAMDEAIRRAQAAAAIHVSQTPEQRAAHDGRSIEAILNAPHGI